MSWDRRSGTNRRYYCRCRRGSDGRPIKLYVGTGAIGRQAAEHDQAVRQERIRARQRWEYEWAAIEAAREPLNDLCRLIRALQHATLVLGGYYRHQRSVWRRRRPEHERTSEDRIS